MADGYFDQVLGWLKGGAPETKVIPAPPLASYPSSSDADYARQYGFSQRNEHQQYLDNDISRVLGRNLPVRNAPSMPTSVPPGGVPLPQPAPTREMFLPDIGIGRINQILNDADNPKISSNVNLNKPINHDLKDTLNNVTMRAALAANRNPIAAVGFDPSRVIIDSLAGNRGTIAGGYLPSTDSIYSNVDPNDPSTMVHESIHRGMEKLRQQYPDQMKKYRTDLPSEESVVRYLMSTQAGDPEKIGGSAGLEQRKSAGEFFENPLVGPVAKRALGQVQELAIDAMKNRGKRVGPQ